LIKRLHGRFRDHGIAWSDPRAAPASRIDS